MEYRYIAKKSRLNDSALRSLQRQEEVLSEFSPRQLKSLIYADFQFPNGDTHALEPTAVFLDSAEYID
jgi:hypothetical protein